MYKNAIVKSLLLTLLTFAAAANLSAMEELDRQATELLQQHCLRCHNSQDNAGELSLEARPANDWQPESLLELITPTNGKAEMPREAPPLSPQELEVLGRWIRSGANWPVGAKLKPPRNLNSNWWSLQSLPAADMMAKTLEETRQRIADRALIDSANPIDWFVVDRLAMEGLAISPPANRRTLIRRLYYDLIGLPPTPREITEFENNADASAYEQLVDRLLESPRYGERWARHWLDVVHYADTHGYDKDKPRPNAWPYRDYVIRALNNDKPWNRFILEQVAGDQLFPDTVDGIEALGFIAAGPWDFVGHAEVPESKIDGKIARHLDRDDMVRTVVQSFMSLTVGCAQCHDHKFDPITQQEYYQLQAVFSAVDRADKPYFDDPELTAKYALLTVEQKRLEQQIAATEQTITKLGGERLKSLDDRIKASQTPVNLNDREEFGYHSNIESQADVEKWVQLDLGEPISIQRIVVRPAFDLFNNIGADFGLPKQFKISLGNDIQTLGTDGAEKSLEFIASDQRVAGQLIEFQLSEPTAVRYVRLTASKLAPRLPNDFCFAVAEIEAFDKPGDNVARKALVTSVDSIEAPARWGRANLVDGIFPRQPTNATESIEQLKNQRTALRKELLGHLRWQEYAQQETDLARVRTALKGEFPAPKLVYAATVHTGNGAFQGTGADLGRPREIHVLHRGEVTAPRDPVVPGALSIGGLPAALDLPEQHTEGQRRVALAKWLANPANTFTWRSVVNRVWQYHFGTGLVDSPNDFGQMGGLPSHPQLLDWLAIDFRDNGQSLKQLHRRIVTSRVYQQSADGPDDKAVLEKCVNMDAENRWMWRANRRKLDAEAVRDSILLLSGKLALNMGGPGFEEFVMEKPEHSPHYRYDLLDFENPATHRRTIYRFTVRSQLQPFLNSLDCADPSIQVATRNQGQTPLQALAMLNNGLVLTHSRHFAAKLKQHHQPGTGSDSGNESTREASSPAELALIVQQGFEEVTGRLPAAIELRQLTDFAAEHGIENYCRLLFNLNEFLFID